MLQLQLGKQVGLMTSKIIIGHLYAIFIIVVWGLTFVSSKILLRDFTPVEILFDRFLLATLALFVVCPKSLKFISWKVELYSALVGFFGITLYFVFENNALIYTNAANASLIVSTSPFFVGLLNRLRGGYYRYLLPVIRLIVHEYQSNRRSAGNRKRRGLGFLQLICCQTAENAHLKPYHYRKIFLLLSSNDLTINVRILQHQG